MISVKMLISSMREPVSGLTHFFTALAAVIGFIILVVVSWGKPGKNLALSIYGISLILMFASSAAYHMIKASPKVILVLRKLDHSAIYVLIAGTYTPFCLLLPGAWQWGMLITIWSLAAIGIALKLILIHAPRWITAGVYVFMGWLGIISLPQMLNIVTPPLLAWLAIGGVVYTLGAIVYAAKLLDFVPGVFGFHEVWHIFVILGALAHYVGILIYIAPG